MGQVQHGSATTTAAVRRAIQHSQESLREFAQALWDQPQDGSEVAEAQLRFRSAHRPPGAQVNGSISRGRAVALPRRRQ